ncbi:MAG: FMN-binding protein [Oscillospiraceae bacterium]|nr:FMN-binding protein [Oscillospiraceae bacterium]
MKKRIALLTLGLMLVLAACGSPAPAADPAPPPQPDTQQEAGPADEPAQGQDGLPLATATFNPGTFTATAPSYNDNPLTVAVTFAENQITGIEVVEHGDSTYGSGWFWRSYPGVPDQILVRQSTQNLDTFTGATFTQTAIVAAVEDAIGQAGANPGDLAPQSISAPLSGDRFIPGFHEITVPHSTMDIHGDPLEEDAQRMLYSEEADMTLRVSFGRNTMHLHSGGARGLGQGEGGHGESAYTDEIQGGTWGGWWFRQVAHHQINDRQSTQVDTETGATSSASAIVWGVNQAIIAAGGNPAALTPGPAGQTQITRNYANPDARFFVPGVYAVTVPGFGGDLPMTVTLDRSSIRRIVVGDHSESDTQWEQVWPAIRDMIYEEQTTLDLEMDTFTGATTSANAILDGVRQAMAAAGETNQANH